MARKTGISQQIAGGGQNVLIVDDSGLQRRILALSLRKWGYRVIEASTGAQALKICQENPIDLILSDWMMPGMDGLEFCRQFRALKRENYGYFILLTSKSEKDEVAHGLEVGADDFLTKPVNSNELRARLKAGERVLKMEKQLFQKNKAVSEALQELQSLYLAVDRDLIEAKKFQHTLVPETHREFTNARVSLLLQSCGHVGGDMIGMFHISRDRVGLYAVDVSGHGVSSALLTARIAAYLSSSDPARSLAMRMGEDGLYKTRPLAEIAAAINSRMLNEPETELYLTLALADVDLKTGKTTLLQAGHPHPVVVDAKGESRYIGTGGPPIGLIEGAEFEVFSLQLQPKDRLLLYSDGFTEAANAKGDLLDEEGFSRLLKQHHSSHGPELLANLVWEVTEFSGKNGLTDDLSAVALEYDGPVADNPRGTSDQR